MGGSSGFHGGGCGCCLVGLVGVGLIDFFSLLWAVVVVVVVVVVVCSGYTILIVVDILFYCDVYIILLC